MRVYFLARGVKTTGAHNLRTGLPENDCLEQLVVDVSQALKQEGVGLAAASRAAAPLISAVESLIARTSSPCAL